MICTNCKGCGHSQKLAIHDSETSVCMHPDKRNMPCTIILNDVLKALTDVILKQTAIYEQGNCGEKKCYICNKVSDTKEHALMCPVKLLEDYNNAK